MIGALASGCDSTRCTGLQSYDTVDNSKGLPWTGTTRHERCGGGDVCVMEDGLPTCAPWWSVVGRSPWFLGTVALALAITTAVVVRRRRTAARPQPKDDWRAPPSP
ncbi:MAG TPA: hypothetical protein VM261_12750 [Kofleriaceae bacterium]|nr:hypothetical protein [Kofleriaceae bacterium]